ncbi:hypothetical protein [Clostridium sp. DL1XJH146]
MASIQSKVLHSILKCSNIKNSIDKSLDNGCFENNNVNKPPKRLYSKLDIEKISIFTGTNDILEPDALRFKSIDEEKGGNINYFEYKDIIHVWPFLNLPESKKAIGQIISLVGSN